MIISFRVLKLYITHGEKEFLFISLVKLMCDHLTETSASFELTIILLSFCYSSLCNFAVNFPIKRKRKMATKKSTSDDGTVPTREGGQSK